MRIWIKDDFIKGKSFKLAHSLMQSRACWLWPATGFPYGTQWFSSGLWYRGWENWQARSISVFDRLSAFEIAPICFFFYLCWAQCMLCTPSPCKIGHTVWASIAQHRAWWKGKDSPLILYIPPAFREGAEAIPASPEWKALRLFLSCFPSNFNPVEVFTQLPLQLWEGCVHIFIHL